MTTAHDPNGPQMTPRTPERDRDDFGRVSLIGRKLSRRFRLELIVLVPGAERPPDAVTRRAALVVVERGEIEIELTNRVCQRFGSGAVLYTAGLPLRVIRNVAPETVLMSFLSRGAHEESA